MNALFLVDGDGTACDVVEVLRGTCKGVPAVVGVPAGPKAIPVSLP